MAKKTSIHLTRNEYIPLAVLALALALSAGMLYVHYTRAKSQLLRDFTREKVLTARYTAGQIQGFMDHERAALQNVAGNIALTGDIDKGRAALERFFKSRGLSSKLSSFFVLDARGRFLYSVPESLVDRYMQDLSGENYFKEVSRTGGDFSTGAQPDKKGTWEMVLSTPIPGTGRGRPPLGVICESLNVKVFDQMFIHNAEPGRGGYAFLVDENGRLLAHQKAEMLYEIESSSEALRRMMRGDEGTAVTASPETGEQELVVFSPVKLNSRTWSVGMVSPPAEVYASARGNIEWALAVVSLMTLAFIWSLVSVVRSGRYQVGMRDRNRASGHVLMRNRELTALNDISAAFSGDEDVDGLLRKTIDIVKRDIGVEGGAVRLVTPPAGDLVLNAHSGMPEPFVNAASCVDVNRCFCGKVMVVGKPVYLGSDEIVLKEDMMCREHWNRSLALVPLVVRNRPLGVLYLTGLNIMDISEERGKFLAALGSQLALGIENALQRQDMKRCVARAGALYNTALALTKGLDLDALLATITTEAASLLGVKRSLTLLYNEEANRLECRVASGFDNLAPGSLSFSPTGAFWEAMGDGRVHTVDIGVRKEEMPAEFAERTGLMRFILSPLVSKGKTLGFMVLDMKDGAAAEREELKLAAALASQAAVAIEMSSFYIRTVERYNEDLQQLSSRIIAAQEEEKSRISRDLHDELGQVLTAIKTNLEMVKGKIPASLETQRAMIGDTAELVASTFDVMRRLSFDLRPPMLDDLGLSAALGRLISDFRKRTDMEAEFSEEGPEGRLSPQVEVALYRMVQEALTNVVKHSSATRVVVDMNKDPNKGLLRLMVEDNGKGFALHPDGRTDGAEGFGLMGIRERASLLGGNFRISSEAGMGTRLVIDIPWVKGE